jgi:hypothetical protein
MTRKTIDYARLGVRACEAFMGGPAAFADFVRMTLSACTAACASNDNGRQIAGAAQLVLAVRDEALTGSSFPVCAS